MRIAEMIETCETLQSLGFKSLNQAYKAGMIDHIELHEIADSFIDLKNFGL